MAEGASDHALLERFFEGAAEQRLVFARRGVIGLDALATQMLVGLRLYPATTVGELAKRAEIVPPTVSRTLRELRQRGLAVEEPDPGDARIRRYRLSPEGRLQVEEFSATARALLQARRERLPRPTEGSA